ncbi:MAG: MFS transporter [Rickettsiaceae bacterium]|nr:MFS transporter [Rickettsiaceae bacterium]
MDYHKKFAPFIIATALFMENLDATILNNAIPSIAYSFSISPLSLKLALTSYLFSLGLLIPISGYLSDRIGTKKILIFGISVFCLGSLSCGFSSNLTHLVISRIIQGVGGAFMMPVCRLILLKTYEKSEVVTITNYITLPSLIGPAIGPALGGFIVTYYSWSWIFFINIPFCLFLIVLSLLILRNFQENDLPNMDYGGCALFCLSSALAVISLAILGERIYGIVPSLICMILSFIFMRMYFVTSYGKKNPFIDIAIFNCRTFYVMLLGTFFSRSAIGGVPLLITLLLQIYHNYTPIESGTSLLFYAVGMASAKFVVKSILKKLGYKVAIISNTILVGISLGVLSLTVNMNNYLLINVLIFAQGFFTSLQFTYMNTLTYIDIPTKLVSIGTSLGAANQQISMSCGVAILAFLFGADESLSSGSSYQFVGLILSIYLILSSVIFFWLDKSAGSLGIKDKGTN